MLQVGLAIRVDNFFGQGASQLQGDINGQQSPPIGHIGCRQGHIASIMTQQSYWQSVKSGRHHQNQQYMILCQGLGSHWHAQWGFHTGCIYALSHGPNYHTTLRQHQHEFSGQVILTYFRHYLSVTIQGQ